jgi:hypothetical protein
MEIVEPLSMIGAKATDIEQLEHLVGAMLPADYRDFLIENNGGRPAPSAFRFEQYQKPQESLVDWFFTLNEKETAYLLPRALEVYMGRIPAPLLPIACDPFGNLILLDLGAKSVGPIYFWDHENENPEGDPWWDNISFVASSFTEFVKGLH